MELIVGGAFQGQLEYAEHTHPGLVWADGADCSREELLAAGGVFDFQEFIRKSLLAGEEVSGLAAEIIAENPGLIVVSDEVGYGVVPMEAFDRAYREAVGRVCTQFAAASDRVVRVVCGIGTVIKGD